MDQKSILNNYSRCGQSDSEQWHVIYTRPNFEKRVDRNLKEIGFHSYLPLHKQLKCWNDRKAWVETPIFRSYVFIKTNLKKKDMAFKVDGILKYVSNGRKLAILSEKEINRIKQLCLHPGKIDILIEDLKVGKKIEISGGVLKGLKGYLTEVNDHRKVRIHIEGLNCFASVTIDSEDILFKHIS